jgi:acetamidase/formamidase
MTTHRLDPTSATVTDVFSRDRPPVLTVAPGDTLVVRSLDASGFLSRPGFPGDRPPRLIPDAQGHCLTGPVAVQGARPGAFLSVRLASLRPDGWGWTVAGALDNALNRRLGVVPGEPSWLLWDLDVRDGTATESRGFRRSLAPFLGVIGVAPAEAGQHSTVPPRSTSGGNIDCRELGAGSTLYLPVQVEDALLSVGDGHAAQGDGEVGGTAIECAMTTELIIGLETQRPVPGIHAVTPDARITFGFDADLNVATADALDAMLTWLQALHDLDRATALAFASAAVDLRVTQVANRTWGVHAVLADGLLERVPAR